MPRLSDLAEILVKCRVVSRSLWDEAERAGDGDLSRTLDYLAKTSPSWWDGPAPTPPGLTEYQRTVIESRFEDNELDLLRRDLALNQFLLLDKLGQGGQGEVYRSRQLNPPRFAAVKILIRDTEVRRKRFEQEAKAMIRIQHPAVARFYLYERIRDSSGNPTDEYLIAMEFVNGTDLNRLIRKHGSIPWPYAVRWVCDLLGGLDVVHQNGFIHRDVKPENVMIVGPYPGAGAARGESSAKLLDLGAANRVGAPAETGPTSRRVFVGTMEYAAPEQWGGEMVVASDLYALGGTLFYMLTGRHVFQKDRREPLSFMNAHMNDVVPDVQVIKPGVPADLAQLIYRMLAKDHNARGTAAELLVEFKKLVPREVPLTPPPATKSTRSPLTAKELAPSVTTAKPRRPSAAPEAKVQNPLVRAADVVLSLVERIFIPDDVRPQAGDELGFAERLMALLRRPLVLVLIFAVMLVIVLIVLI